MKKHRSKVRFVISKALCLMLMGMMVCSEPKEAEAVAIPVAEIIKQGVTRVIVAVDLRIQRLQNESIWLQNAQKTIENALSKLRLSEISDWTSRQKELYQDYYQGLWKVKSMISQYQRLKDIALIQKSLIEEYQKTWSLLQRSGNFSPAELQRKQNIYAGILSHSIKHLDQFAFLMRDQLTNMGDAARLDAIHDLGMQIQTNYDELRRYNRHNMLISQYRNNLKNENNTLKSIQQ